MKLEIPVKVYFDDVQGMVDEVKRLQTYKLSEGDDMVLVDLDDVVSIMVNHIRATDNYSESPNGWIPCSERLPETDEEVLVTDGEIYWVCSLFESTDIENYYQWEDKYGYWHELDTWTAWMPLPTYEGVKK